MGNQKEHLPYHLEFGACDLEFKIWRLTQNPDT